MGCLSGRQLRSDLETFRQQLDELSSRELSPAGGQLAHSAEQAYKAADEWLGQGKQPEAIDCLDLAKQYYARAIESVTSSDASPVPEDAVVDYDGTRPAE